MSLWGNKDFIYSDGSIAISGTTLTGTGTTFNTASLINEGDVVTVGSGATYGEAVVSSVDSATQITLKSTGTLTGDVPSGTVYFLSQKPVYTLGDSNYQEEEIFGVDTTEQTVVNGKTGDARKYAPAHSGWVGITSYTDMHGNFRVKTEVLVATGTITGDADDDKQLPDS